MFRRTARRRAPRFLQVTFALTALAATHGSAHEMVDPNWCIEEGVQPVIVEKFSFDEKALWELIKRCGIVDGDHHDQWDQVSNAIGYYCSVEADQQLGTPVPFVAGPKAYLSKDHHKTYSISQGLSGSCAVCMKKR